MCATACRQSSSPTERGLPASTAEPGVDSDVPRPRLAVRTSRRGRRLESRRRPDTMRGRELAYLDPADRLGHGARAPRPDALAGTGRGRPLFAADRARPLEGAVSQAPVPAYVDRRARAGEPGACERH